MTKISLIAPICIAIASGCALFDGTEMGSDKPPVSAPVMENVMTPVGAPSQVPAPPVAREAATPRPLSQDDIRRLQVRLREMGLDPGPVDGVAGPRTKHAFERLRGGCAKVAPLVKHFPAESAQVAAENDAALGQPSRAETTALQNQLRSAGFNPGPADGIFGNRTKAALAQLHANCLVAKEFDGRLDGSLRTAGNAAPVARPEVVASVPRKSQSSEVQKQTVSGSLPNPQEEVRILQLRLRDAGFDPGPFDGVMGPKTRRALAQYEASQSGKKIKTSLTKKASDGHD